MQQMMRRIYASVLHNFGARMVRQATCAAGCSCLLGMPSVLKPLAGGFLKSPGSRLRAVPPQYDSSPTPDAINRAQNRFWGFARVNWPVNRDGNYVGDATACECEDATKNDDGSDSALTAATLGYGAIAAAALLA